MKPKPNRNTHAELLRADYCRAIPAHRDIVSQSKELCSDAFWIEHAEFSVWLELSWIIPIVDTLPGMEDYQNTRYRSKILAYILDQVDRINEQAALGRPINKTTAERWYQLYNWFTSEAVVTNVFWHWYRAYWRGLCQTTLWQIMEEWSNGQTNT